MTGPKTKRGILTLVIVGVAVLLGAILGRAQSVFPVRFDPADDEKAAVDGAPPARVALANAAMFLPPQSTAPFACDASTIGWMYLQCVNYNFTTTAFCLCKDDPDDGNPPYWGFEGNDSPCTNNAVACP